MKGNLFRLCLLALSLSLSGCSFARPAPNSVVGYCLDTVVTITGYCDARLLEDALELCRQYEALLSRTVEGSDVWRINNSAGKPVSVSDETAELLRLSLEISRSSGGAFDVTIAPAAMLWDFDAKQPSPPSDALLAEAAAMIDYSSISLDGNTVTLPQGMAIDLGGIGKGYIADRMCEFLYEAGVSGALVNLGGNTAAIGTKPGGEEWRIGIQQPGAQSGQYLAALDIQNASVVTSGTYERGFDYGGIRYHHILDPETACPVQNGLVSVTVVASSSALADGLSTACFALGVEDGLRLAGEYGVDALFIDDGGEMYATQGMEELLC